MRERWTPNNFLGKSWHPPSPLFLFFLFSFVFLFSLFFSFLFFFYFFLSKTTKNSPKRRLPVQKLTLYVKKGTLPHLICFSFSLLYYFFSFSHFILLFPFKNHKKMTQMTIYTWKTNFIRDIKKPMNMVISKLKYQHPNLTIF